MKRIGARLTMLASCAGATMLAGCQPSPPPLPSGEAAYQIMPARPRTAPLPEYRIGPFDIVNINVFQEPDLSLVNVTIDASGKFLMPLVGNVEAAGRTTTELSNQIALVLDQRYLRNAHVSVLVQSSVSQSVTVEGSVTEPGVYQLRGWTALVDAVAMAKGPTSVAKLDQVVVFREIDGVRSGALFNLTKIRRGEQPNPQIRGGDEIVVGLSNIKQAYRDILATAPFITVFRPLL